MRLTRESSTVYYADQTHKNRLRSALEVFTDLQERCDSLFEETEILRDREAMALDEADRLGLQNSELIGHGNGSQKISYVEGLRREMALVKHVSTALPSFSI